jgi:hypothetical protein
MLRLISLCLLGIFSCIASFPQRHLETIRDPANPQQQSVVFNTRVLIAGNTDSFLLRYDDVGFTQLNYPLVSGARLRFYTYRNPLVHYGAHVLFSLHAGASGSTDIYLYRFNGTSFSRIVLPGNMRSNCIIYGTYVYFLVNVSGVTRLYRYNGTVTEVAGGSMPNSANYQLQAAGGYLYAMGVQSGTGTTNFIRRFNGSTFLTLPYSGPGANVQDTYAVPGTPQVYFTSHERILYYDGSTVRQVFSNTGESMYARMWRNSLYFTAGVGVDPSRLTYMYRITGATVSLLTMPGGARPAPVPHTNPEIFEDRLYVGAVYPDGSKRLLRYDGAIFTPVFDFSGFVSSGIGLFLREGKLMIQPNFVNGKNAFEYNGSTFTEIIAPTGRLLFPWINSTPCNHLWLNYYTDATGIKWAYARESKDCPPPAPPAGVPAIPEHIRDYERFDLTMYGPGRGWCWSEIVIDWVVVPVCPVPPCPDPNYEVQMINANNGLAWSQKFTNPSTLSVPLADQQAYKTVLLTPDNGAKDLFIFEPDLVQKGIESIKINMKPKSGYFLLSATTRQGQPVDLQVSLLDAKGNTLWTQTFTAPFSKEISATVNQPGQVLVFAVPTPFW